jgi:hypothetical protein
VDATGISLDRAAPSSAVSPLPPASLALFNVTWGGADATSGVASYDVQYRVDGGAWVDWQMQTTSTQALFVSAAPHTYGFRSRATDRAGNVEAWPGSPDTTTTVSTAPERVYVPLVAQP